MWGFVSIKASVLTSCLLVSSDCLVQVCYGNKGEKQAAMAALALLNTLA
jgi:hypothetical protein